MSSIDFPPFDNLTLDPSGPKGNAWGLFGKDDQLGMLNLLTPEVVATAAREEIREGLRFSLDWELDRLAQPAFGRQVFERKLVHKAPRTVNDDVVTFNTQSSTQWDGFRHYGSSPPPPFFFFLSGSSVYGDVLMILQRIRNTRSFLMGISSPSWRIVLCWVLMVSSSFFFLFIITFSITVTTCPV